MHGNAQHDGLMMAARWLVRTPVLFLAVCGLKYTELINEGATQISDQIL